MDEFTIGLIGCGGNMGAHKRAYELLRDAGFDDFRIVACCDLVEDRAADMADEIAEFQPTKPDVHTDVEKLLDSGPNMDAVDISLVHRAHHQVAIPCLEAGKHLTMEKPLAITMRAGKKILDAADAAGTVFQVAENYRRAPEQRAINWAIKSGRIGEPRMIFWFEIRERLWHWAWREVRDRAGGGWPLDGGVHFADLFRYHIGPVESVFADVEAFFPYRYEKRDPLGGDLIEVDVEDTTCTQMTFENGAIGTWVSTSAAPEWGIDKRAIYGSEGTIHLGRGLKSRDEELDIEDLIAEHQAGLSEEEKQRLFPNGVTDTIATELKEFMDACRGKDTIETDGMEGYKAMAICFALYESDAIGAPVQIADIENLKLENYQQDLNEDLGLTD